MPQNIEDYFKEIMLYDSYCHAPAQEPLLLGVMKFTIFIDLSLVIITIYFGFQIYVQE